MRRLGVAITDIQQQCATTISGVAPSRCRPPQLPGKPRVILTGSGEKPSCGAISVQVLWLEMIVQRNVPVYQYDIHVEG